MNDFEQHLGDVQRSVASLEKNGQPACAVTLARSYDTTQADLWDAVTDPERLARWFAPVTGDLTEGGRYQIEGNAGGVIEACERPTRLSLTWEFGDQKSWVVVELAADGDRSRLTLTHIAPVNEHWEQYGAGATGVGWELGYVGLALHLADPEGPGFDEEAFAGSPEGQAFLRGSAEGWGRAHVDSGEDAEAANAAAARTAAFFTGQPLDPA